MNDAYAAGLFDGEGFVRVADWKKPNSVHVRYQVVGGINMTHFPVIEQLHLAYGGSLSENRHDLRMETHRIVFNWQIGSQIAARFFRMILPHLIVKREEVELALQLQDDIDKYRFKLGNRGWLAPERDEIFSRRAEIAAAIHTLKKRTYPPLDLPPRNVRPKQASAIFHSPLLNDRP